MEQASKIFSPPYTRVPASGSPEDAATAGPVLNDLQRKKDRNAIMGQGHGDKVRKWILSYQSCTKNISIITFVKYYKF